MSTASTPYYEYEAPEGEDLQSYRTVSKQAVISLVLALLAIPTAVSSVMLVIPLAAIFLGFSAIRAIRRYPDELTGKSAATLGMVLGAIVFVLGVSAHAYIYATEVPEGYRRTAWTELRPETRLQRLGAPISKASLDLSEKKIFIKGYVLPGAQRTNLKEFILVPDMGTCCFGGDPKTYDMILVKLSDQSRVNYSLRRLKLWGEFRVDNRPTPKGGRKMVYYHLQADGVK